MSKKYRRASKNKAKHKGEIQFARTIKKNDGVWRGKKASEYKTYKKKKVDTHIGF